MTRSGENTVRAANDKDGVLTNHAQTRYHQDACVPSKALLSTHIYSNTRIDAAVEQERQKLSDRNKHVLGVIVRSSGNGGTVEPLLYDHPQNHIGVVV